MNRVLWETQPAEQQLPFTAFAAPCDELGPFAESIACENARELVRRLLGWRSPDQKQIDPDVAQFLEQWSEHANSDLSTCWHDAFSKVLIALQLDDEEAVSNASIGLAMHLSSCGVTGRWSAAARAPMQCHWDSWLLPEFDRVTVESSKDEAVVVAGIEEHSTKVQLVRLESEWINRTGVSGSCSRAGHAGHRLLLLPKASADKLQADALPPVVEQITPEMAARWQDAITFIGDHAPEYGHWIRAIQQVAVVEPSHGVSRSGSYGRRYGFIHGSALDSIPSTAEMLVHEASHQYFFILGRLGPVDDGTDSALYYSPLVDSGRPLRRILFAFHACANILAFYRRCLAAGVANEAYFVRNEKVVVAQIQQLSLPLRENPALTPVGRALFEPWAEKIA